MAADHHHGPTDGRADRGLRNRLLIAFGITALIVLTQAIGSVITGSLALLTDTAHALSDSTGLLVAVIAATMMLRPPSSKRTWGFARIEVVAALGQALLLLVVGSYAAVEGLRRLLEPAEVQGKELLFFGIIGLAANIAAMVVLSSSRDANFNMRAAFLEVLNDALGSLGVIVAAIVIATTGFQRADTIAGLFIAALILPRAYRLLRETVRVLMEFTPKDVDLDAVRAHILELDHVHEVHDLHASTIGTGLPVVSAHVVIDDDCFESGHAPQILEQIRSCLKEHFPVSFEHATIQMETTAVRERTCTGVEHF
ncbi:MULTISPECIES: cation diffusion facilitator family transporter [Janibacter]|uniref:Cobalt-zinc-cadmium efflux system protein n=1 Tax=Janibacter indicus TaxID=857417 RepID=A0A1W2DH57_9MICO|nr:MULTISPECIES: cation diffusion facilitator family transporter [Janibacter]MCA0180975.1 cation diffusion facilitator family transporter [Actinomycetota bacterium]QNF94184.1 cation transporter [Janibacter sp. YB324]SMC96482.1 cobalt-zinc-cadmium efflux system protein [Janibacter indicus]